MPPSKYLYPTLLCSSLLTLGGCQMFDAAPESAHQPPPPLTLDFSPPLIDSLEPLAPETASAEVSDLWERLRQGFALPAVEHPRIDTYVQWYTRNQRYLDRVSERGERYLYHIVGKMEAAGLPRELALLPIVESAFDPFAYSHSRASGIWQFMPATGRQFGLKQNWWYDGRRDIVAATDAAVTYLTHLNTLFGGDWLLALAAYNSGQGTVRRALARNRREGRPADFWSLRLPRETRAYVPQLLALSRIVADPTAYKLTLPELHNGPYFAQIDIQAQMDLAQAAKLADTDIDELYLLNPAFNRWATDPEGPHRLLIPQQQAEKFDQRLAQVPLEQRVGWERYRVVRGDNLIHIARRYNTSVDALRVANDLRGHMIREGQALLIPTASQPSESYALSAEQRRVRHQQNSGQGTRVDYTVRAGDSLWRIANRHQVSTSALARWNNLAPSDIIRPGQTLVLWTHQDGAGGAAQNRQRNGVTRQIVYRVRNGDSLARIAGRFNVSITDILSWNSVHRDRYIHPGQTLTLFVDVTGSP